MNIIWNGYCYGTSGYANAGRGMLSALMELGDQIQLLPIDRGKRKRKRRYSHISKLEYYNGDTPDIAVFHRMPNGFSRKAKWNVGMTYWETTRLPIDWVDYCNQMDQIILFSEHNRNIFQESGVKVPIDVISSGVNISTNSLKDPSSKLFGPKGLSDVSESSYHPFTFLAVSQWIPRKGFDILLKAYFEEFRREDDVLLIIKTNKSASKSHKQIYEEVMKLKKVVLEEKCPSIIVYSGRLSEKEMNGIYKMGDAYVLASRGEGVGLPYLEAGNVGLPVIATGWGGQMDFLNEENSYLLDFSMIPAEYSHCSPYYANNQMWAEPSQEHLQYLMRRVYENHAEAIKRGNLLKKEIEKSHNWLTISKELKEKINSKYLG